MHPRKSTGIRRPTVLTRPNQLKKIERKPVVESDTNNDLEDESSQSLEPKIRQQTNVKPKEVQPTSATKRLKELNNDDTDHDSSDFWYKRQTIPEELLKTSSRDDLIQNLQEDYIRDEMSEIKSDEEDEVVTMSESKKSSAEKKSHNSGSGNKSRKDSSSKSRRHGSARSRDSSSKSSDRSKRKKSGNEEIEERRQEAEVPITEILKSSDEHRTKYEEPAQFPELTTNTVYYIGQNGFNAMRVNRKRSSAHAQNMEKSGNDQQPEIKCRPIKVAIAMQRFCLRCGTFYQGLLGGAAALHLIFLYVYFNEPMDFVTNYSHLAEVYASFFTFLLFMSLVATLDKFDCAHISVQHTREIFQNYAKSILAFPIYVAAFVLHQYSYKTDDKITLVYYNMTINSGYVEKAMMNATNLNIEFEMDEIDIWKKITISKDTLVLLGWFFIAIGNRKDMLLEYLKILNAK